MLCSTVLKRAQLCVNGYRHKINAQMQAFTLDSLSDVSSLSANHTHRPFAVPIALISRPSVPVCLCVQLSATLLSDEESISLLDYIVRQVYVEDLPDDPYATSPSAPSMLSGLPALTSAAATSFPPLTSPPHPLHLPTYNLLSATLTHLSRSTASAASSPSSVPGSASSSTDTASPAVSAIASQRVLRVLRQFVADWKYSERKLGLKEPNDEQQQDDDEEVVGMGDWLADAADEDDEGEVETMSMADFLGGPEDEAVGGAEDEDDDKDQDEERGGRDEHRIDVGRAVERKESRPPVGKAAAAKLPDQVDEGYEEGAEDELDEVRLDDLEMDELEGEEDAGLELVLSPSRATSKPKGLK